MSWRYKYERVVGATKLMKPYVVTRIPLSLEAGKPVKVVAAKTSHK